MKNGFRTSWIHGIGVLSVLLFASSVLADLSGDFEGRLERDLLVGQWSQLGDSMPLPLSLYAAPQFSEALIASIEGRWEGTITMGGNPLQAVIWRFEVDDFGQLIGFMGPADRGRAFIPMQNIVITGSALTFTVNRTGGDYSGEISAAGVVGNWTQQGLPATLNMTPRADDPEVEDRIYSEALLANVLGGWSGTITRGETPVQAIVWRFESSKPGKVIGFIGPAAQGVATIPMQNILITETALSFNVNDASGEFSGRFSDNGLEGSWTQPGQELSLNMSKDQ